MLFLDKCFTNKFALGVTVPKLFFFFKLYFEAAVLTELFARIVFEILKQT